MDDNGEGPNRLIHISDAVASLALSADGLGALGRTAEPAGGAGWVVRAGEWWELSGRHPRRPADGPERTLSDFGGQRSFAAG